MINQSQTLNQTDSCSRSRLLEIAIVIVSAAVISCKCTIAFAASSRPNIILIMCDDLGYADVSFNGATDIKTPELDALALNGTICTAGFVPHPFCGPSRMGMMTGRYPHDFGAPFNLPNSTSGMPRFQELGVDKNEELISSVLQRAGYFTGAIGKWHMGKAADYHPNNRGFDEYYGFLGGGHEYFPEQYRPKYQRQRKAGRTIINDYVLPLEHNGSEVEETEYITDGLSREAARFVRTAANKNQPFFLFLAYNAPHTPLQAKELDLEHYQHIPDEKRRTYLAMVHAVDRGVGKVVKALKETDRFNNTLIVFLSDNGGKLVAGASNVPLRDGKGSTFDGGFRVPMFFHWPGHIPPAKYSHPITALDFYPTFAALASADIPHTKKLDGKDIFGDLVVGRNCRPDEMLFALRHRSRYSDVAVRLNQWKAVRVNERWRLFDTSEDKGELHDLSDANPEQLDAMISAAESWSASHQPPLWFHAQDARDKWHEEQMPHYESTFQRNERTSNN